MVKKIEYQIENGKFISVKINGKAIKKSYASALEKVQNTEYWVTFSHNGIGVNPFTSVEVELNPIQCSIYQWLLEWYYRASEGYETYLPMSFYNNLKYLFLDMDADAYFDLID